MQIHGCDGAFPPKSLEPERSFPVLLFGPFRLDIAGRLLERNGMPVSIGARAFDILVALALHAGHTVRHDELMSLVWANVTVTPVSLRGNIANLRKALGDKRCGARYIINNTGRGYCFVAPVTYAQRRDTTGFPASHLSLGHNNAPSNRATEQRDGHGIAVCEQASLTAAFRHFAVTGRSGPSHRGMVSTDSTKIHM
jgi:DNA-binding winged helix-turn-helix (wHTH) protein